MTTKTPAPMTLRRMIQVLLSLLLAVGALSLIVAPYGRYTNILLGQIVIVLLMILNQLGTRDG